MAQAVSMHARSSNIITVLAPISVADLRSDSSQVQSSFSSTMGKAHTTRLLAQTPRVPRPWIHSSTGRISSQNTSQ